MKSIPSSSSRPHPLHSAKSSFFSTSFPRKRTPSLLFSKTSRKSRGCSSAAVQKSEHDVVVVGAGIIGLTIARQFLLHSDLSVAVVDAKVPCSGATGAGQGYLWMGHKTPGSGVWELSMRSKKLWEDLAGSLVQEGLDPFEELGWKKTGSLLVGRTSKELAMLHERVAMVSVAGLEADYLPATALHSKEPEIDVGDKGGGAFFPGDCQLDAMQTVSFIEKGNRSFLSEGRYTEFYNNPAIGLKRSNTNGDVEAVLTPNNILYCKRAVVIATGAWSGLLMQNFVKLINVSDIPVKPRKGHLLILKNFLKMQLNHGIMEVGYIHHLATELPQSSLTRVEGKEQIHSSISMTATLDTMGNLVLGSSRQFCGFDNNVEDYIIRKIWDRAGEFFPSLREVSLDVFQRTVRVGLRPWMPDGKPIVSPISSLPKVFLAVGHEGGGLCMALGTAEMVADMVLGETPKLNPAPFSIH